MSKSFRVMTHVLSAAVLLAGGAGLYLKNKVIEEMHDPSCCKDGVSFSDLGPTKLITPELARAYHVDQIVFIGGILLMALLQALTRKRR